MIIEDERNTDDISDLNMNKSMKLSMYKFLTSIPLDFLEFIEKHVNNTNSQSHYQLQSDLIKHIWQLHGQS
jgi:hypothetical protein